MDNNKYFKKRQHDKQREKKNQMRSQILSSTHTAQELKDEYSKLARVLLSGGSLTEQQRQRRNQLMNSLGKSACEEIDQVLKQHIDKQLEMLQKKEEMLLRREQELMQQQQQRAQLQQQSHTCAPEHSSLLLKRGRANEITDQKEEDESDTTPLKKQRLLDDKSVQPQPAQIGQHEQEYGVSLIPSSLSSSAFGPLPGYDDDDYEDDDEDTKDADYNINAQQASAVSSVIQGVPNATSSMFGPLPGYDSYEEEEEEDDIEYVNTLSHRETIEDKKEQQPPSITSVPSAAAITNTVHHHDASVLKKNSTNKVKIDKRMIPTSLLVTRGGASARTSTKSTPSASILLAKASTKVNPPSSHVQHQTKAPVNNNITNNANKNKSTKPVQEEPAVNLQRKKEEKKADDLLSDFLASI